MAWIWCNVIPLDATRCALTFLKEVHMLFASREIQVTEQKKTYDFVAPTQERIGAVWLLSFFVPYFI